jgi:hypothetical protein
MAEDKDISQPEGKVIDARDKFPLGKASLDDGRPTIYFTEISQGEPPQGGNFNTEDILRRAAEFGETQKPKLKAVPSLESDDQTVHIPIEQETQPTTKIPLRVVNQETNPFNTPDQKLAKGQNLAAVDNVGKAEAPLENGISLDEVRDAKPPLWPPSDHWVDQKGGEKVLNKVLEADKQNKEKQGPLKKLWRIIARR